MIIKHEALRELALFNATCPSVRVKSTQNAKYLYECTAKGEDVRFDDFLSGFPQDSLVYHNYKLLRQFAQKENAQIIERDLVRKFFGGSFHARMTLEQLSYIDVNQGFKDRYLFAHLLLPVRIKSLSPLQGLYSVDDKAVEIRGLLIHPLVQEKLKEDDEVFVHFATVLSIADEGMKNWLISQQINCPEFMSAVAHIRQIDYGSFRGLGRESINEWTRSFWRECEI